MMYDDELRNPIDPSTNPWNKIEAYDYDVELEQADCEAELSHLVPQARIFSLASAICSLTPSVHQG